MAQSIKKANHVDHIDRISDLPGNVIDGILKHLNIPDIVSTSILSRKWRYMWMSVPELEFCYECFSRFEDLDDPGPEISRIITEVLFLHNGLIYKFTLDIPFTIKTEYLNKWILFLSRKGIKDLELRNYARIDNKMPSHIFSCQELTHFRLSGFKLSVPPNFCGFKQLLDLCLDLNTYEFGALENFISCCPLLEKLSMILFGDMKSVCLKNAKNLIDLRLMVELKRASGLIKSLPKIHRLAIDSPFCNTLYADMIPPTQLISLKYLKLSGVNLDEKIEVLYIVSVLKSASDLVELDIKNYDDDHDDDDDDGEQEPDQPEQLECNSCCLSQLQTVNISVGTSFKHAMSLIRFVLANSSSLKTLTFKVGFCYEKLDAAVLLSISRNLLRMERASQRARVEFLQP
ncbi:F-box/FBD/LRR-repeat protein At1g13570-like isoform X1 [Trifolium pratense]|uniref:F-box/FBD/LRR-repeat protein At1g13570-like isoform X1 n=1 Tax=Trifolium pratense TaxID=57577 RepID=UPI001E69096D|nr:F-box/FBD/LRR-repeat protein At1g13570-like isoform X1 [Trifolium pratense]